MGIRRIVTRGDKMAHRCLKCSGKLGTLRNMAAVKCHKCGTVHLISFTERGNIILTDKKYKHLFKEYQEGIDAGGSKKKSEPDNRSSERILSAGNEDGAGKEKGASDSLNGENESK